MAFRDTWHRALVYFGLAEDHEYYDDDEPPPRPSPRSELEDRYRERPNVRRLSQRRRRDEIDDIFADDADDRAPHDRAPRSVPGGRNGGGRRRRAGPPRRPKSFNDAQDVADKFKDAIPVILNLQGSTPTSPSA